MRTLLPWVREIVRLPRALARPEALRDLLRDKGGVDFEESDADAWVLEITPNRPDLLSHLGIAREIAALSGAKLRPPDVRYRAAGGDFRRLASVRILAPDRCARYCGAVVEGVRVGPSPRWMAERLEACGIRAISNVVDVTNYVLLEMGHPLHAFDLDRLEGRGVVVRLAQKGERIRTLDGVTRTLTEDDLVIADAARPVALAGVMGGEGSEVLPSTTRLLIESAHFAPESVRRTSRRHGLRSESSYRFERGTDRVGLEAALRRTVRLVLETAGGAAARGILDVRGRRAAPRPIRYRPARAADLLGPGAPPPAQHAALLRAIGCRVAGAAALRVEPPPWRVDLVGEEDLLEEVARLRGYDRAASTFAPIAAPAEMGRAYPDGAEARRAAVRRLRRALAAAGLRECMTVPFDPEAEVDAEAAVAVRNPLQAFAGRLRTSPWPSLRRVARLHLDRGATGAALFESGRTFHRRGAEVEERPYVAALLVGEIAPADWRRPAARADVAAARAIAEAALGSLGIRPAWREADGALRADACEIRRLDADSVGFLVDAEAVAAAVKPVRFRPLPRYPAAVRDVSLVVPAGRRAAEVEAALRGGAGPLLETVGLFDVFEMPDGRRSLAFRLAFRAADRTLAAEEVEAAVAGATARAAAETGAVLRGPAKG